MIVSVPGFDGIHVSADGRVFSSRKAWRGGPFRELQQLVRVGNRGGYPDVKIEKGRYRIPVHQLVLTAFHGPRSEGMVARHLDGNPVNNSIDNLTWGTVKENQNDRHRH